MLKKALRMGLKELCQSGTKRCEPTLHLQLICSTHGQCTLCGSKHRQLRMAWGQHILTARDYTRPQTSPNISSAPNVSVRAAHLEARRGVVEESVVGDVQEVRQGVVLYTHPRQRRLPQQTERVCIWVPIVWNLQRCSGASETEG